MNVLKPEKKISVLTALLEGCSLRATARMTGVHRTTIMRLLIETGARCEREMDSRLRGLRCDAVECDEIWTFIQKKQRQLTDQDRVENPDYGDGYAFIAFDPDSKAVIGHAVGKRDWETTELFIDDLRTRLESRVQLSTDGWMPYRDTIESAFGSNVDYSQIVKTYASEHPGPGRYSPPKVSGVQITRIEGHSRRVCTSYVERNNWTIRTHLRRFTRLSNGFSRKLENLKAALALWLWFYNFCRIHGSTRITPAMALGITDRAWELAEIVA
ncbi:MAG: hypothetical protein IIA41_05840 [SAR324 cluster bacterium]|nr:hypothetical protein [SAR324 cluster bacterium]